MVSKSQEGGKLIEERIKGAFLCMEEKLLTASQLSERLGVHLNTVYMWRKQGRIPSGIKIGRSRRWRLSEINDFLGFNN